MRLNVSVGLAVKVRLGSGLNVKVTVWDGVGLPVGVKLGSGVQVGVIVNVADRVRVPLILGEKEWVKVGVSVRVYSNQSAFAVSKTLPAEAVMRSDPGKALE